MAAERRFRPQMGAGTHTRQTQDVPVKRHLRGEPGHTRDTQDTRAHAPRGHTDHTQTNFTTSQPSKPNDTPARARDGRNRGRLNSRKNSPWRTAAGPEPTAPRGRPVYSTRYAFTWCGVGFEGAGIDENLFQNNNLCLIFTFSVRRSKGGRAPIADVERRLWMHRLIRDRNFYRCSQEITRPCFHILHSLGNRCVEHPATA